jgi:hypothetical protein
MAVTVYPYESGILGILGLDIHPSSVEANSDIIKRFANMTTEELAKIMYGSMSRIKSNIEVNETTFGGEQAFSFEFTSEEGYGKPLTIGYSIFTIKDNKIYMANYEDTNQTYNDLFPTVKKVIDSVEIFSTVTITLLYKFVKSSGSYGTGDGQFDRSTGITINPSTGDVFVADTDNNRIQKFDSNGNFITKWGIYGTEDEEFDTPMGISVDISGNVYVTEFNNDRIQVFTK